MKNIIDRIKNDEKYRIYLSFIISMIISFIFSIYNLYLGIFHSLIWNLCISFYYILLLCIRFILFFNNYINKSRSEYEVKKSRFITFIITSICLLLLNLVLIAPAILMVQGQKEVNMTLIPSIALAAYTTYKITLAIIKFKKYKSSDNLVLRQMRLIKLIDALVSILTLQNTLILVNGGMSSDMVSLSMSTTITILAFIALLIIISFINGLKTKSSNI